VRLHTIFFSLPYSDAVFRGKLDEVIQGFEQHGSRDEMDVDRNTPVHWAAMEGHTEILNWLITKNFPVSTKNKDGDTPLCGSLSLTHLFRLFSPFLHLQHAHNKMRVYREI
jgi:hypothetical protein